MSKSYELTYSMVIILNNMRGLKVAKRVDLKCFHHKKKEMVIMCNDKGVS